MNTAHLATLLTLAAALAGPAQAFNPQPDPPARIGAVTLNPGQTLRLNVRMIKAASTHATDVPPGPCRVSLGFLDGESRGLGQTLVGLLRPGQATRLDLVGDGLSSAGNPLLVHPVVRVVPAVQHAQSAAQGCAVAVTAELLDAAGHVTVIVVDPLLVTPDSTEQ